MLSFIIPVAIGALLGTALGIFGKCTSGTCPLTSTWWRGALYGASMGLVFGFVGCGSGSSSSDAAYNGSTNVVHVSQAEFESAVLRSEKPVLVDFYADWCGPCKVLAPTVARLADEYAGRIKVAKVDVDQAAELAQRYRIEGIPMLIFFKNGEPVDSTVGVVPEQMLRTKIEKLLPAAAAPAG